jgi:putative ABC transport system substrate-binding protein
MNWRKWVAAACGAVLAGLVSVVPASAQPPGMARIGILQIGGPDAMGPVRESLAALGYLEGTNVQFEVRSAEGQVSRLPELAADLVRSRVDVIIASLTPAVTAAKNATREIPIVMAPAGEPVATGLVASLARPGGNITGYSGTGTETGLKNLELIREAVPQAKHVTVLANATDPFTKPFLEQIEKGAGMLRIEFRAHMIRGPGEIEAAFIAAVKDRSDAVIIQGSLPIHPTVDLALTHRLPALSQQASVARAGALMSYSASFAERGQVVAAYVDKILKGAKPADLPVQQPTRYQLILNLKTAKAIGLAVPAPLLARADEVIE